MRQLNKIKGGAARVILGTLTAGSGLLLVAGIANAPGVVNGAGAQTTATTNYAPPTSAATVPAASTTTLAPAPPTTAAQGLAFTGADVEATIAGGAALIAAGGLLVLGVRNRRRRNEQGTA